LQVSEPRKPSQLDDVFAKGWINRGASGCSTWGGGNNYESYEQAMAFAAYRLRLPNMKRAFYISYGDEGYRDPVNAETFARIAGEPGIENTSAANVVRLLDEMFQKLVFHIHLTYGYPSLDEKIFASWQELLGRDRALYLPDHKAVTDTILGLFAIMNGERSHAQYLQDLRDRDQKPERVRMVGHSLSVLPAERTLIGQGEPFDPATFGRAEVEIGPDTRVAHVLRPYAIDYENFKVQVNGKPALLNRFLKPGDKVTVKPAN
jgi:hypothetical protein